MESEAVDVTVYLHSGEHFDLMLTEADFGDDDTESFEDYVKANLAPGGFFWLAGALIHPRAIAAIVPK